MSFPVKVTFHNTRRSESAEALVRELAERLTRFHQRITDCEVVVDVPHHHHNKGNEYHVRVLLAIPGQKVVTHRHKGDTGTHPDLLAAVREAFDVAERRLRNHKPREKEIRKFQRERPEDGLSTAAAIG